MGYFVVRQPNGRRSWYSFQLQCTVYEKVTLSFCSALYWPRTTHLRGWLGLHLNYATYCMEFAHLQFKTALTRLPALIKPMVSRFHAGVARGQLYDFLGQEGLRIARKHCSQRGPKSSQGKKHFTCRKRITYIVLISIVVTAIFACFGSSASPTSAQQQL